MASASSTLGDLGKLLGLEEFPESRVPSTRADAVAERLVGLEGARVICLDADPRLTPRAHQESKSG